MYKEVWNSAVPKSLGTVKWEANVHMLYTPPVSNNITLAGDDRLRSDLPEQAFITNLSRTSPSST